MSNENNDYTVPSDPAIRKRIRDAVSEASAVQQKIDDYKAALKDIVEVAKTDLEVPKKTFTKMVKTFHKQEYAAVRYDNEVFQEFYETVMEDKN